MLADEGWGEEISSHRKDYIGGITQMKGVRVAQPLTEKGMSTRHLEESRNSRTFFSVERDEKPDTQRNASLQKGDRRESSTNPLCLSCG
jgi:hypothetical protein